MKPRLSACLIVRNEEQFLSRCLASLQGWVDEICVLDTGSQDRTLEIARSFGAICAQTTWEQDFSKARNACLQLATGDWILQVDADEELASASAPLLRSLLTPESYCHLIQLDLRYGDQGNATALQARLFRRDPRIRYRRALHETVLDSLAEHGLPAPQASSVCLIHHGYAPDLVHQRNKHERNRLILEGVRQRGEADTYDLYKLAGTLDGAERFDEADAMWLEALQSGQKLSPAQRSEFPWWPRVPIRVAQNLQRAGLLDAADALLRTHHSADPGERRLCRARTRFLLDMGRTEEARSVWNQQQSDQQRPIWELDPDDAAQTQEVHARLCLMEGNPLQSLGLLNGSPSIPASVLRARSFAVLARKQEAWQQLDTLLENHHSHPAVLLEAGLWARKEKQWDTAHALLQRASSVTSPWKQPAGAALWFQNWLAGSPSPWIAPVTTSEEAACALLGAVYHGTLYPSASTLHKPTVRLHLADLLESLLAHSQEDIVRTFARAAASHETSLPGISRLVEGQ